MKKWIILMAVILTIICLSLVTYFMIESKKIGNFKIIDFHKDISDGDLLKTIEFETSKNALSYRIEITNTKNEIIYKIETGNTKIKLDEFDFIKGEKYTAKVYAIDKNEKEKKATNDITINWSLPNILVSKETPVFTNQDLILDTNIDSDIYQLVVSFENKELKRTKIEKEKVIISKDIYSGTPGEYHLQILTVVDGKDIEIDHKTIDVKLPEITDILFTNPKEGTILLWDDFDLTFTGGEYATHYEYQFIEKGTPILEGVTTIKKTPIEISKLKEDTEYILKIKAYNEKNKEMQKNYEFKFKTGKKQKAQVVIANPTSGNYYIGQTVELSTTTKNSTIYYTTDGTNPTENSKKYTGKITLAGNTTIKAIAISKNYLTSDISTFNYQATKRQKTIYLSPSNQVGNLGVQSIGYTNESIVMNRLADIVEPILKNKGFKVYRNKVSMTLDQIVDTSKSLNVDLHIALHSNALNQNRTGVETYVYTYNSPIAPLARKLQSSLETIYYKNNPGRVHYGLEEDYILREINPKRVDNGILIEVAYHDQIDDARWILNNLNSIGNKIANTIVEYFS